MHPAHLSREQAPHEEIEHARGASEERPAAQAHEQQQARPDQKHNAKEDEENVEERVVAVPCRLENGARGTRAVVLHKASDACGWACRLKHGAMAGPLLCSTHAPAESSQARTRRTGSCPAGTPSRRASPPGPRSILCSGPQSWALRTASRSPTSRAPSSSPHAATCLHIHVMSGGKMGGFGPLAPSFHSRKPPGQSAEGGQSWQCSPAPKAQLNAAGSLALEHAPEVGAVYTPARGFFCVLPAST